jgi:nitrogenase molybdenum-iron protein alpha/beta subunit
MKLAYWMYAGPAHIGTLRIASSFKNVHAIMHAPLGDDYFNVMRSMLERERTLPPSPPALWIAMCWPGALKKKWWTTSSAKTRKSTPT